MKDIGSWRCQKKLLCLLTTGRLMGVTVISRDGIAGFSQAKARCSCVGAN
jgi:hypothetical protein